MQAVANYLCYSLLPNNASPRRSESLEIASRFILVPFWTHAEVDGVLGAESLDVGNKMRRYRDVAGFQYRKPGMRAQNLQ